MPLTLRGQRGAGGKAEAFTLIELLVSTAVVSVILVLMISVVIQASAVWRRSSGTVEAFQSARLAYELITRNLSQATLNAYLDYDNATTPTRYLRKSELAFRSGRAGADGLPGTLGTGQAFFFQSPLGYATNTNYTGLETLLNTCGYYITFTTNSSIPSHVSATENPYRYRLMQMLVPTERNDIYKTNLTASAWFSDYTNAAVPVADNIIALIIRPQDPASDPPDLPGGYTYDTRTNTLADPQPDSANQLPPVMHVTMVAIDETAAKRLDAGSSQPPAITAALGSRFQSAANFQADLAALEASLIQARIPYRVFSSAVPMRESKWTK